MRSEQTPDGLIVEGYAYVNAKVKSDRYNLLRSSMEEASRGYVEFPAVREMHDSKKAAGTGIDDVVKWDDRGCALRALIVDSEAIKKIETGVYRGLSVGIRPLVMRGNDVTKCEWFETSLVDRPADPGAIFSVVRSEECPEEVEVEIEEEELERSQTAIIERAAFAKWVQNCEDDNLIEFAFRGLQSAIYGVRYGENPPSDIASEIRTICSEFGNYIAPRITRGEMADPELTRSISISDFDRLSSAIPEDVHRAAIAKKDEEITRVSRELEVLRNSPLPCKPFKGIPGEKASFERTFAGGSVSNESQKEALQKEIDAIVERSSGQSETKKLEAATEINRLRQRMAEL